MRRFHFHPSSLAVFGVCLVVGGLHVAFFRVGFRFESRVVRPRISPPAPHHTDRPWFMRGGTKWPRPHDPAPALWPHESGGDRIVNQLMYAPRGNRTRVILLFHGRRGWPDLPPGPRGAFAGCPADNCEMTTDRRRQAKADLVLFKDRFTPPTSRRRQATRPPEQIWLLFLLECPLHTQSFKSAAGLFNWTASYRHDSDIVAPYEKWVPYAHPPTEDDTETTITHNFVLDRKIVLTDTHTNRSSRGGGKVAWFVSNCAARNRRLQYARELSRHVHVDLFGKCGAKKTCPRSAARRCFRMLGTEYKFYLAFENSNCRDYITEKFFVNGLGHDVIPIVMGARPEDYLRSAPPHSFLHVEDYPSPAHLAAHLKVLDSNPHLYAEYFKWKRERRGEFIDTKFWCRLCALLHAPLVPKVYTDMEEWWNGKGTCTPDQWRTATSEETQL